MKDAQTNQGRPSAFRPYQSAGVTSIVTTRAQSVATQKFASTQSCFFQPILTDGERVALKKVFFKETQQQASQLIQRVFFPSNVQCGVSDFNIEILMKEVQELHSKVLECAEEKAEQWRLFNSLLLVETSLKLYLCNSIQAKRDEGIDSSDLELASVAIKDILIYAFLPFARALYFSSILPTVAQNPLVKELLAHLYPYIVDVLTTCNIPVSEILNSDFQEKYQSYLTELVGSRLDWPGLDHNVDVVAVKEMAVRCIEEIMRAAKKRKVEEDSDDREQSMSQAPRLS